MSRPRFLSLILLALPSLLWGQTAVEVQVTPAQLTLKVAQEERLFLSAYDADGNLLTSPGFSFAVSRAGVVSVDTEGTVVGVAPGKASIEVRSGTGTATVAVTVTGPPPPPEPEPAPVLPAGTRLVPTPDSLWLLRLEASRVSMALVTPGSSGLGQVNVAWRSTAPDIVSVSETGEVTALQLGQAQVVGTGPGGLTGVVHVIVRDDSLAVTPERLVLSVNGVDSVRVSVPAQGDRPVSNGIAWRSSDSTIMRVSRNGVVRGASPGESHMLLVGFGQQRAVRVTVHPPVARLLLAPAPSTPIRLTPGTTTPFTLQALAADSSPVTAAGYDWVVGDTTVATFDSVTRRLTARGIGRTTLSMTTFGFEPTIWDIDIIAGGLAFERTRLRLLPGMTGSLIVSLLDADGRPIGRPSAVDYTIDRPEVATVDSAGNVAAASVGGATITARTPWGTTASTRLFVTDELLLSVRRGAGADIVQVDPADVGSLVPLIANGNQNQQPVWSFDGTRIAFSGTVDGNADIYAMDADGKNLRKLTNAPEEDSEPAWSPDGGTIAFTSLRSGSPQIWAMNIDGTGVRQLTEGAGANTSASFRSDGKMIAFISTRDGNADLFEMGNEGAEPRAITRTPEAESHPAYFSNGDVAIVVTRPGRGDILRIRAGDGQRVMLQSMAGTITSLALAPDGGTLAFSLTQPVADPTAPPIISFQLKGLTPDLAPLVLTMPGDVVSASFQGGR